MKFLIYFLPIYFLTGCVKKIDSRMLIGNYFYKDLSIKDSLFILPNNTYKHKYITPKGDTLISKGKWKFSEIGNKIKFQDFTFFEDETSGGLKGNWISKVRVEKNKNIHLMYSAENDIYYEKSSHE